MAVNSNDCLQCRLISGFGLIGISAYVYYQAKHRKKWENYSIKIASAGFSILGVARLLNLSIIKPTKD